MKNFRFLLVVTVVLLSLVMISCTGGADKNLRYIPQSASAVAVVDGSYFKGASFSLGQMLRDDPEYESLEAMLEEAVSDEAFELWNKFIDSPKIAGIDYQGTNYAFFVHETGEIVAVVCPIHKSDFDKTSDVVFNELKMQKILPENAAFNVDGKLRYFAANDVIIGRNDDVCMFMLFDNVENPEDVFKQYMSPERKNSIAKNKDFMDFYKNCLCLNLWVSTDLADKNLDAQTKSAVILVQNMFHVKLDGNYAHVHIGYSDGEFTLVTKVRVNESIQNIDWAKLRDEFGSFDECLQDAANDDDAYDAAQNAIESLSSDDITAEDVDNLLQQLDQLE